MQRLKAVLFDNDGTIADTRELLLDSFRHATQTVLGRTFDDEAFLAKVGIPLARQMEEFSPDPEIQQQLLDTYRAYNHERHDQGIRLFPGELEALQRLRDAGLAMGVVTSKMHWLAWRGIEVLGLDGYMSALVGPDDCAKSKPDPEPVELGARLLGLDPRDCAYVGDSPFDIAAGNAAGCYTVAVTWGMFAEDVLREQQPDAMCHTFGELASLLVDLAR